VKRTSFLTAHLSFLYLSGYWKERAGGASGSMKKITRTQILNEQVPVLALSEQRRIMAHLSEQMAATERTRKPSKINSPRSTNFLPLFSAGRSAASFERKFKRPHEL